MAITHKSTFGFCRKCNCEHSLGPSDRSQELAEELISKLESSGRLDYDSVKPDPKFSTDYLFGPARGQMFGVLVCENSAGEEVAFKAFSCQYNSYWLIDGWVPPLLDLETYNRIVPEADVEIKRLSKLMDSLAKDSVEYRELKEKRKQISQKLMKDIHDLYIFHNFSGQSVSMYEAFAVDRGIPTGAGDCCAPKLLNHAAKHNLKPLGISEFYYGKENKSATRKHKHFYSSCMEKCYPLLGFMLCGVD